MKKTLWIAIVGALAASVVAASAQEVLSANAVGYIKKTLPAGGQIIAVSLPLDNMNDPTGSNVFGRTSIAQEAPELSYVYFWDEPTQKWLSGQKRVGLKAWQPAQSNYVVKPGEGFFMKGNPADTANRDVTITGEVPPDSSMSRGIVGSGNISTMGNPYPVDFKFGESSVATGATDLSYVYFWDEPTQKWLSGQKRVGLKAWQPAQSNYVVKAGEGFFLKEAGTVTTWTPVRPYTWPHE